MIRVIINADDLGKSHEVNMAIGEALRENYVTSSTIMANSTTWEDVHTIVEENPQASFGVHLNLTEGLALTDSDVFRKYKIVDENNQFTKNIRITKYYPKELLNAIYDEWDAQINKIVNVEGIKITHLDGHHHIHREYSFLNLLISLIMKYDIHIVRNRYKYTAKKFKSIIIGTIEKLSAISCLFSLAHVLQRKGSLFNYIYTIMEDSVWRREINRYIILTDFFNAYETQVKLIRSGYILPDNSTAELMCHPGHPDFTVEYEMIKNKEIEKGVSDIQLISYKNLK